MDNKISRAFGLFFVLTFFVSGNTANDFTQERRCNKILDSLRKRISVSLYSLSEKVSKNNGQRSNIKGSVAVTPRSKFAIACATLGKFMGLTRSDTFYRCEYDLREIKAAAETDSYLRMAIKKYTELFIKSGYVFKGKNDEAVNYLEQRFRIMSYMTDQSFDLLMKETAYDLVKFSNAFWVKTRVDKIPFIKANGITNNEQVVGGYFRVDPDSMQIKFDKNGQVAGYKQVTESGEEKKFDADDVIHFTFDRDPGSVWGVPRWIAALEDIRILRKIEGDALSLLYRYSMPMMHAKVGLEQAGMQGTEKEVDDTRAVIEHTPPDGVLITTERVKLDMIGAEGNAIDMAPYLNYFENRVFTALNTSQAMMGRGGSKQDADSMEEQIHNAVKDNQSMFAVQFQHAVIAELLLEGGFNPVLKDEDIVDLSFNEINLDTKVKLENHEVNLFQSNAITFEELRKALGYRNNDVDESRLYANMLEQKNRIEQIDLNHENAMELAKFSSDLAIQQAKATEQPSSSSSSSSSSSKSGSLLSRLKKDTYTKKNTGNGKTTNTSRTNGSVRSTDAPSNQHGTFSAKVKEAFSPAVDSLSLDIDEDGRNLQSVQEKMKLIVQDATKASAKEGAREAFRQIDPEKVPEDLPAAPESPVLKEFVNMNLARFFMDINSPSSNSGARRALHERFEQEKYRLHYLVDLAERKAYWYSFAKICGSQGMKTVRVKTREGSRHASMNGKVLNTNQVNLNDIPGFSSNCTCTLEIER